MVLGGLDVPLKCTYLMLITCSFHQAWERLEKAEHERELALRTELIRQEKLEQLARRFDRKAAMRETWLSENQRLVSQVRPRPVFLMPLRTNVFVVYRNMDKHAAA